MSISFLETVDSLIFFKPVFKRWLQSMCRTKGCKYIFKDFTYRHGLSTFLLGSLGSRELRDIDDGADENDYSAVIEVDLAGPESVGCGDSSRASSCSSSTPDGQRRRARGKELTRLLGDECKELRRKGLGNLTHSDQRVTRCRTKSAPVIVNGSWTRTPHLNLVHHSFPSFYLFKIFPACRSILC